MKLTIVIPAHNESESLPATLTGLKNNVKTAHDVIVVDDHSTDDTGKVVLDFSRNNPYVKLVKNETNPGFTNAIKRGFREIIEGVVVLVMADFCDDPHTIDLMYEKINEGYDVVCGSRYMKGGKKTGGRFLQTIFSKFVGHSLHLFTNIPVHDVSNAFKMYKIEALNSIEIEEAGFASSLEIVLKLYKKGFKITEVPTAWRDRVAGKSNFKLLKVARNYIRWYLWALFVRRGMKD